MAPQKIQIFFKSLQKSLTVGLIDCGHQAQELTSQKIFIFAKLEDLIICFIDSAVVDVSLDVKHELVVGLEIRHYDICVDSAPGAALSIRVNLDHCVERHQHRHSRPTLELNVIS